MTKRIHNFIWGFMYIYPLLYLLALLLLPLLNHNFVEYENYFLNLFGGNMIYLDAFYDMCFYYYRIEEVLINVCESLDFGYLGASYYLFAYLTHVAVVFFIHICFETIMWLPQLFYRKFLERKE